MKLGVVFPQTEIGTDPAVLREYVQTVEGLGYDYLMIYDHVLGANPVRPGGWSGPYTYLTQFHEPMVVFGWMAALTGMAVEVAGVRQAAGLERQAQTIQAHGAYGGEVTRATRLSRTSHPRRGHRASVKPASRRPSWG